MKRSPWVFLSVPPSPHPLGDEDAAHRGRPAMPSGELNELHVDRSAPRHSARELAVTGVLQELR